MNRTVHHLPMVQTNGSPANTDCQQNCHIQGTKDMILSREVGDYHSSATSSTSRWKPKNVDCHMCVLTK